MTPAARLALLLLALLELALAAAVVLTLDRRNRRLNGRVDRLDPMSVPGSGRGTAVPAAPVERPAVLMRPRRGERRRDLLRSLLNIPTEALPGATLPVWVAVVGGGVGCGVAGALCASFASPLLAPVAATAGGVLAVRSLFGWQRRGYASRLLHQMPDAIELVVSAVRAGLPVAEALRSVAREMPSPTCEEFAQVCNAITLGQPPDVAVRALHGRTGLTEYGIFSVTLAVQSRSGGRLAETIQNLAETTRQRVAVAAKAHALSAEARLSAYALIVLPILAAIGLSVMQPGYLTTLVDEPAGRHLLAMGGGLLVLGTLTMRVMIRKAGEP